MGKHQSITATDYDGNSIELLVGATIFDARQYARPASDFGRGSSWVTVETKTLRAISPNGRPAFRKIGSRFDYEPYPLHRVLVTLDQVKRFLLSTAIDNAALARETAKRAQALVDAIADAPTTLEGLNIQVQHERTGHDVIAEVRD